MQRLLATAITLARFTTCRISNCWCVCTYVCRVSAAIWSSALCCTKSKTRYKRPFSFVAFPRLTLYYLCHSQSFALSVPPPLFHAKLQIDLRKKIQKKKRPGRMVAEAVAWEWAPESFALVPVMGPLRYGVYIESLAHVHGLFFVFLFFFI